MDWIELGKISTIIAGQSPPSSTYNSKGNGLPFFQGKADFGELYPTTRIWCNKPAKIAEAGDILISVRAPVGPTNVCNERCCIGRGLSALRPGSKLIAKYLLFYLRYIEPTLSSRGRGSTFHAITQNELKELFVPLVSIENQKRIVAILDKADALRQKRKQALALLDELLRSTFLEMFGDPNKNQNSWCVKEIGEICTVTKLAGFEYTKYVKYSAEGEVIVIRGLNIKEGKLKLDNIHYIDKKTSDLLIRSKLFKNDVVMTYIGVNIGDVAIIDKSNKYHLAPNVAKITPKNFDKLNSIYLMRCLEFNRMQFQKYTTNTAKQALNMGNIRQLKIPIPPIELQNRFAKIVEQTEATKVRMQQSLQELENQFQALLQRAFKGEL